MKKNVITALVAVMVISTMTGCMRPVNKPEYESVADNETAFVVPLMADSLEGQKQLQSVEFLNSSKVAAKEILITKEWVQTGRPWIKRAGYWKPNIAVLKTDRTPVSMEWVDGDRGDENKLNDGFVVESSDSIGFVIGGIAQAMITEEDAALFRYSYSGKSLATVMQNDVKPFMANQLTHEFGNRDIEVCKTEKGKVFSAVKAGTVAHFKQFGITITHVGQSGEITYLNPEIQKSIDEKAKAEMDRQIAATRQKTKIIDAETKKEEAVIAQQQKKEVAEEQRLTQEIINKTNMEMADAERYVKEQQEAVMETVVALKELDIREKQAEALLAACQNYQGGVSTISMSGGGGGMSPIPFFNMTGMLEEASSGRMAAK